MKKLLKSFLIATASIGTIAGSTAAVVSCGSSEEPNADNANYTSAVNAVITHFKNNKIFYLKANASSENIIADIQKNIKAYVEDTSASDKLTDDQKAALDVSTSTAIVVTLGTLDKAEGSVHAAEENVISVSIPASQGFTASSISFTGAQYEFVHVTTSQDYTDAVNAVINHFKNNNIFSVEVNTTNPDIITAIQNNIKAYVEDTSASDKLIDDQKAALDVTTSTAISVTINNLNNTNIVQGHTLENVISVSIPAWQGLTASSISFTGVQYEFTHLPTQDDYTSALNAIVKHFTTNELFLANTVQMGDGTNNPSTGAITNIKPLIQKNILAFINNTSPIDKLSSIQRAAIKPAIAANDTDISITLSATLERDEGDYTTNNISITIAASGTLTSQPTVFTAAKYAVADDNFINWNTQANAIIDTLEKKWSTMGSEFTFKINTLNDAIKNILVTAINDAITATDAANKTELSPITPDKISLEDNSFDNTYTGITQTSVGVSVTFVGPNEANPPAKTLNVTYLAVATDQTTYDSAINKIKTHFLTNNIFTLSARQMTTSDNTNSTIKSLIQESVLDYINSTGTDKLTAEERDSLIVDDVSDITVEITGSLQNTIGSHIATDEQHNISITIPSELGAIEKKVPLTGVIYTVTATDQDTYDYALGDILQYFTTTNLFSATQKQIGDGTDTGASAIKAIIQKNIYDYVKTYTGEGDLPDGEREAFDLTPDGANITVAIVGTLPHTTGDQVLTSTNYIRITMPAASGAQAGEYSLNGAKYKVTPTPPQELYEDTVNAIKGLMGIASNAYIGTWTVPTNCPSGITSTPMQKAAIETILNNNNDIITFWRTPESYNGDPGQREMHSILKAIDDAVASNILTGVLTVTIDESQVDFSGNTHLFINYTFTPYQANLTPLSFKFRTNIYH